MPTPTPSPSPIPQPSPFPGPSPEPSPTPKPSPSPSPSPAPPMETLECVTAIDVTFDEVNNNNKGGVAEDPAILDKGTNNKSLSHKESADLKAFG